MGHKYPILKPKEIIKALERLGFRFKRQTGSHARYRNEDGKTVRNVSVPMHYEVDRGTLMSILEQADITLEEFLENL